MATTLSNTDIENLDRFKSALNNDKTLLVREFAIKYGTDGEIAVSSNNAIYRLCRDNSHAYDDWAFEWVNSLSDLYQLNGKMEDTPIQEAFDKKMREWIEKGVVAKDYPTEYFFLGAVYYSISKMANELDERLRLIRDKHYYVKTGLFRKVKIIALHHYDDVTLRDFNRKYDRYEIAALMLYAGEKFRLSTEELQEQYDKVRRIVYAFINGTLASRKKIVEKLASSNTERSLYAYLFVCAVMEYTNVTDKMGLFKKLFWERQDNSIKYSVMYPKIEVVDLEEWKWGYDPFGYPEQKEASEEIGVVWDIWPIIISQSCHLLLEKYSLPFNRKYGKYMKWEKPNDVPKFYHLRFTYKDKDYGIFIALQGGDSTIATMERTAYDAFIKGCEENNMIPLIANGWGIICEPDETQPYYIRLYDAYSFNEINMRDIK
jgi:hypothetical protein